MAKKQEELELLIKEIKPYLNKGHSFCPDTNFFMECPELFHYLKKKNEKVLISKITYDELDNGKHAQADATDIEKERAWKRRKGLEAMDTAQAIRVPAASGTYMKEHNLEFSNDEKIIGSYLKYKEEKNENVLFLTLDRGAKTIARSVGIPIVELNITEFFRLKNQTGTPSKKPVQKKATSPRNSYRSSNGNNYNQYNNRNRNKKNPIVRAVGGVVSRVVGTIQMLIGLAIVGFIGLLVLALILQGVETSNNTEAFNHIVGDQGKVSIEVTKAKDHAQENEFEIAFDLTNHTSGAIDFKGYYTEEDLKKMKELEGKQDRSSQQYLETLRGMTHGIKIVYKDGSEEVDITNLDLEPREKSSFRILSNGQLEDIERIDLQYVGEGQELKVLSIDPE